MTPCVPPRPPRAHRALLALLALSILLISLAGGSPAARAAGSSNAPTDLPCPPQPSGPATPANYAGQTLRNLNFAWRDLRNADFSGAVLDGVVFVGADLRGASFKGARFTNTLNGAAAVNLPTDFSEAKLGSACFAYARFEATAAPVYLTGADLACADFSATDITNAVFGDAPRVAPAGAGCRTRFAWANLSCEFIASWKLLDLSNASMGACASSTTSTRLVGVDFSNARMNGFDFFQANLERADFSQAQLLGADLSFANLKNAKLIGAQGGVQPGSGSTLRPVNLTGAYLFGADLTDADLRSASLAYAHIYGGNTTTGGSNFVRTRLDSADLSNAVLAGGVFTGSLTNAVFDGALLTNAVFNGVDLSFAKFNSAYLRGASFAAAASLNGVTLNNADVSTASGSWSYTERDGTPAIYPYGATALGAIATGPGATCPNGGPSPCDTPAKLAPIRGGPYPPIPACTPLPPRYDNCLPPKP